MLLWRLSTVYQKIFASVYKHTFDDRRNYRGIFLVCDGLEAKGSSQKLARIVLGMETVDREMEGMRKALPHNITGER